MPLHAIYKIQKHPNVALAGISDVYELRARNGGSTHRPPILVATKESDRSNNIIHGQRITIKQRTPAFKRNRLINRNVIADAGFRTYLPISEWLKIKNSCCWSTCIYPNFWFQLTKYLIYALRLHIIDHM